MHAVSIMTVGRYEIHREIGRGAHSVVYAAWDPCLRREVAVKTLHFTRADAGLNQMLVAESLMVSRLRHPNLVPIFDAGEQDGDPFLVFEFVQGCTLGALLRSEGAIAPMPAVRLMSKVLDALAHAHAQGIVHRDLKPSNILIGIGDEPRVMDFGSASHAATTGVCAEYSLTGTPAYMAPEYVERREVSVQGDIYGAGLVLSEMLSGQRMFHRELLSVAYPRFAFEPLHVPSGIEPRLCKIIRKACDYHPRNRYTDAAMMRNALEEFIVAAQPPSRGKTEISRWRRFGPSIARRPRTEYLVG
jgi:eukaryotic-like serine/threonine-protein kinase